MSIYVEVMCDVRKLWPPNSGHLYNRCVTDRGDNPQGSSIAEAKEEAKCLGWKVKGNHACCPDCLIVIPEDLE